MTNPFAGMALAVDRPSRLALLHPVTKLPLRDAEGGEAWIELLSWDSAASEAHRIERDDRARRLGRDLTAEEANQDMAAHLAALTTGWRLLTLAGAALDVPCSPEAARALYGDRVLKWVRVQVLEHLNNRGNWHAASATAS